MIDTTKSGGKVAFSIIKLSKTSEYPDGNIAVAMDGLKRKYAPKTAPLLSKLHKIFYGAKLKKKQQQAKEGRRTHVQNTTEEEYTSQQRVSSAKDPSTESQWTQTTNQKRARG